MTITTARTKCALLVAALTLQSCTYGLVNANAGRGKEAKEETLVPESLVGTPLEDEGRACAVAINESLRDATWGRNTTALLKVMTAMGIATAALASGMPSVVQNAAAERHWQYAGLAAAASIPASAGFDIWLNGEDNFTEKRTRASSQAINLYSAGFLMECSAERIRARKAVVKGVELAISALTSVDPARAKALGGALVTFLDDGKLVDLAKTLKAAEAPLPATVKAEESEKVKSVLAEAFAAVKALAGDPPPTDAAKPSSAVTCLDAQRGLKPARVLEDEAHAALSACIPRSAWTFGAAPAVPGTSETR